MKNATQCAKKLTALLKKIPEPEAVEWTDADDPIAVLVHSALLAEATTEKAQTAYRRLRENVVDFNDLRVTMAQEMAGYLGGRYPKAQDRCQRLRSMLRSIYLREHQMRIVSLEESGKREIRKYVESLEGITPFIAGRVMLMCFDVHAIPVDDQLRDQLVAAGAADENATVEEIATWLSRQIKSPRGLVAHLKLQAWVEQAPKRSRGRTKRGAAKTSAGKSATGKKTGSPRSKARGSATR